jgi:hypothetical protein
LQKIIKFKMDYSQISDEIFFVTLTEESKIPYVEIEDIENITVVLNFENFRCLLYRYF